MSVAPIISKGESRFPVRRKARIIPKRTVWLMASVSMDIFRSTRKFPGKAQLTAVKRAITSISANAFIEGLLFCRSAPFFCGGHID